MQRPSVYVGVPEPSSGYLSKASPRHASPGYAATEIVEEQQLTSHVKPVLKKSVWSMKPEETVHLIPVVLVLSGLILSLPTFYNAYQGLPLSTTHRLGGSSAVQMQSMTSGDSILIHPELGRSVRDASLESLKLSASQKDWEDAQPSEEVIALRKAETELKKRKVKSAGLGAFFRNAKTGEAEIENVVQKVGDAVFETEEKSAGAGGESVAAPVKKIDPTKKDKKKEKKKSTAKGEGKKKGQKTAGEGRPEH
eukprot:TRINITY_DN694_c0_g1_i1.p1 TRINITY_DN694_c0_g1~~TRINITY_DN694_c0_g1_i1.p1  ORF type:complete len:252 (-),score=69.10 TRINITY_DN694_c0_g1_i1:655-1410(-)